MVWATCYCLCHACDSKFRKINFDRTFIHKQMKALAIIVLTIVMQI